MRRYLPLLVAFALAFGGCGGCGGGDSSTPVKEIASESIEKDGDVWKANFTSKIDAPVDKVYEAFTHPERAKELAPENVKKSEIVSEDGNKKTIDLVGTLDILPPGFKMQQVVTEYTFYPDEKRITSKTVDFKLADITSEYKFTPEDGGKATLVTLTQQSKDKAALPVASLQKGALRETYILQIKVLNRALGIDKPAPAAQG
jgi:hypothetical protein